MSDQGRILAGILLLLMTAEIGRLASPHRARASRHTDFQQKFPKPVRRAPCAGAGVCPFPQKNLPVGLALAPALAVAALLCPPASSSHPWCWTLQAKRTDRARLRASSRQGVAQEIGSQK
jgi:hypothetical protein